MQDNTPLGMISRTGLLQPRGARITNMAAWRIPRQYISVHASLGICTLPDVENLSLKFDRGVCRLGFIRCVVL